MTHPNSTLSAQLGGDPIRPAGPPPWPLPNPRIEEAVQRALRDGSWGLYHGPHVTQLEAQLAAYHNVTYAITCASGTLAVEAALQALGLEPASQVAMAAYDYESNFLTIHHVGAQPVLFNLALDHVYADLSSIADSPQISALLISHLHGDLAPMAAIRDIADARGIPIIEDAAQAPGAIVDGKRAGAWGDIGILSFGGSKPLCAGRGGAILTSSPRLHQRIRLHLSRGVQQWGALSELQAIALLPQLEALDAANAHRWSHVQSLDAAVREILGITPLTTRVDDRPSFYKRGFWYDADAFGLSRERFVQAMRAEGIALDAGFRALHVGRSSRRFRAIGSLTHAERAHHEMVILHHPVLLGTASDVQEVADAIAKTYANADRLAC